MDLEQAINKVVAAANESTEAARAAESAAREAATAANGATAAANAATMAFSTLQKGQAVLQAQVRSLWLGAFGEEPPEPSQGVDPALVPLSKWSKPPLVTIASGASEKATNTAGDLAALEGRVIAGFADVKKELREKISAELAEQSKAMGIGKKGIDYLLSKAGQRSVLRVLGACAALVAAIGTVAASCRAPVSTAVAPVPTMIIVPAAHAADGGVPQ